MASADTPPLGIYALVCGMSRWMTGIDTTFDFRIDAGGRDPDTHSPTLRRYHKQLWSKPLPGGKSLDLDDTVRGAYLHHRSEVGDLVLASDSVIQTFTRWKS